MWVLYNNFLTGLYTCRAMQTMQYPYKDCNVIKWLPWFNLLTDGIEMTCYVVEVYVMWTVRIQDDYWSGPNAACWSCQETLQWVASCSLKLFYSWCMYLFLYHQYYCSKYSNKLLLLAFAQTSKTKALDLCQRRQY